MRERERVKSLLNRKGVMWRRRRRPTSSINHHHHQVPHCIRMVQAQKGSLSFFFCVACIYCFPFLPAVCWGGLGMWWWYLLLSSCPIHCHLPSSLFSFRSSFRMGEQNSCASSIHPDFAYFHPLNQESFLLLLLLGPFSNNNFGAVVRGRERRTTWMVFCP